MKALALTTALFFSLICYSLSNSDTLNRFDGSGKRSGYWIVSADNKAVSKGSKLKAREGRYSKGRKCGVWIAYFEDGVTPRLIGEYADNRPAGAYFRFDRSGNLQQAGTALQKSENSSNPILEASNPVFSCKMLFENRDLVAGQVFFSHIAFDYPTGLQFWTERSMEARVSNAPEGDYSWLSVNYSNILTSYLKVRTPGQKAGTVANSNTSETISRDPRVLDQAMLGNYYYPPAIRTPRVGRGLTFQPNGLNKLYTENDEIWIDGSFVTGKLYSGKVFIYDRDGILLKVRVYKDGVYVADGVL